MIDKLLIYHIKLLQNNIILCILYLILYKYIYEQLFIITFIVTIFISIHIFYSIVKLLHIALQSSNYVLLYSNSGGHL